MIRMTETDDEFLNVFNGGIIYCTDLCEGTCQKMRLLHDIHISLALCNRSHN